MQLGWDQHFQQIVLRAWAAYKTAEAQLTVAHLADDALAFESARLDALREGGAACIYLHHFADIVANERPPWLPAEVGHVGQVRSWLSDQCRMLRTDEPVRDVWLLRDVADALKHAVLERGLKDRDVAANDAVLVAERPYGSMGYGVGKNGGTPEVCILAHSGKRNLSSVLQNVIDAWRGAGGWHLPEIGQ